MSESSVAARREARMRRILSNAENRLKRITDDKKYEEVKNDIAPISSSSLTNSVEDTASTSNDHEVISSNKLFPEAKVIRKTKQTRDVNLKYILLIMIALLTRYLNYILEKSGDILKIDLIYLKVENIFIPFLSFKIFELIVIQPNLPQNNLSLLLMFSNLNQKHLNYLFKVLNFVTNTMADLCIYFFFFIILDVCIYIINTTQTA